MNKSSIVFLLIGLILGALAGYGLHQPAQQGAEKNTSNQPERSHAQPLLQLNKQLGQQLAAANNELATLREQLASLSDAQPNVVINAAADSTSLDVTTDEDSGDSSTIEPESLLYDQAMTALLAGDHQEASRLFNQLRLTATSAEQKEQAIEGLLTIQEQNYNELRSTEGQTNAALWSLFEMHKLQPDGQTKMELVGVSVQAYKEAQQYLTEDNLLASADHLSSLMHLSRMMEYKVPVQGGESLDSSDFAEELQEIQGDPAYLPRLTFRAENNLYNGDDQKKSQVFWDYNQLATLKGPETINNPAFRTQFVQATIEHLNYLKGSNQTGELQSRMNYIRYAFPQIMNDPLISSFQ